MSALKNLTPKEISADASFSMIDIRPWEERHGEMGYIPASLSVPLDSNDKDLKTIAPLIEPENIVLYCLTGRRSALVLKALYEQFGVVGSHIEGGLLAWSGAGKPLCGVDEIDLKKLPEFKTLQEFPRILASCFVGEMIEVSLDQDLEGDFNFMALLRRCFEQEAVSWDDPTPSGLIRVLDRAAFLSRRFGNHLKRIQVNLDHFNHILKKWPTP